MAHPSILNIHTYTYIHIQCMYIHVLEYTYVYRVKPNIFSSNISRCGGGENNPF